MEKSGTGTTLPDARRLRSAGRGLLAETRRDGGWVDLDANASAGVTEVVARAVWSALRSDLRNPSSGHAAGEVARRLLADARDAVSALVRGSFEDGVVFTSGCTEANNAVIGSLRSRPAPAIVTTEVEHPSVLVPAEAEAVGGRLTILPVRLDGTVDVERVFDAARAHRGPVVVSVQHANGETGVIQPIGELAEALSSLDDALFHSDAAQAFGKTAVAVGGARGADVISLSGHKIHAPMGVGALVLADGEERVRPLLRGGGQERGIRSGTQPLPAIAGLSAACRARTEAFDRDVATMRRLRDLFEGELLRRVPWAVVNGAASGRLANTSNIRFPGLDGMSLVARLDSAGVGCSLGSACSNGSPEPSHVLLAMGLTRPDAYASVRFSFSPLNTEDEVERALDAVSRIALAMGRGAR